MLNARGWRIFQEHSAFPDLQHVYRQKKFASHAATHCRKSQAWQISCNGANSGGAGTKCESGAPGFCTLCRQANNHSEVPHLRSPSSERVEGGSGWSLSAAPAMSDAELLDGRRKLGGCCHVPPPVNNHIATSQVFAQYCLSFYQARDRTYITSKHDRNHYKIYAPREYNAR